MRIGRNSPDSSIVESELVQRTRKWSILQDKLRTLERVPAHKPNSTDPINPALIDHERERCHLLNTGHRH